MLLNLGYGLRSPKNTNSAGASSTSLAAMPGIEFDHDATRLASYPGSGNNWDSLIASPASGATQADYRCVQSGSNPLTYVGSGQSAYWDVDNVADVFTLNKNLSTQPTFLKSFHKATEGQEGAIVVAFRSPAVWTGGSPDNESLFCGTENNNSKSGFKVGYDVSDKEVFAVFGAGTFPTISAGSQFRFANTELEVSTDYLLIFNFSHTGGNTTVELSINSTYKDSITLATSNTADATGVFKLCNDDSATHIAIGTRFYHFSMYNALISNENKFLLSAALQARHNRTYISPANNIVFGGLQVEIPHNNWVSLAEIEIYNEDSVLVNTTVCTAVAGANGKGFTDFTGIDSGEYAVDSTYASTAVTRMNDGNNTTSMWSTNGTSGIIAFLNFNTDLTPITRIRIRLASTGSYGTPSTITIKDMVGNVITPTRTVAAINDFYL